ncbi:MAG: transcriptional regulator, MerR family [Acidimicrobiaceae bacterium]|nr:transcriptional regulator, MerR family [Acidimicrobiaceae bacterium]
MLRIGEAAARTGVSERTLRYYEELGLVVPAEHSPGGNRRYGEAELERVRRVRDLQDLMGLNLDEIRVLICFEDRFEDLRAAWRASPDLAERRQILQEALDTRRALRERVSAKSERLRTYLSDLEGAITRIEQMLEELDAPTGAAPTG